MLLAASLLSSERKRLMLQNIHLHHLSVCASVRKVSCGKMTDWIGVPFGVVRGVGRGMGVLDFDGDRQRRRDSFGGECGASHCNQRGTLLRSCVEVCIAIELSFGVVSGVGQGIDVLDGVHVPQRELCPHSFEWAE